jgi:hypothetical protein
MAMLDAVDPDVNYFSLTENNCHYYESDALRKCFFFNTGLSILNVNIRYVKRNMDELLIALESYGVHFSVIILTETWLNSEGD